MAGVVNVNHYSIRCRAVIDEMEWGNEKVYTSIGPGNPLDPFPREIVWQIAGMQAEMTAVGIPIPKLDWYGLELHPHPHDKHDQSQHDDHDDVVNHDS